MGPMRISSNKYLIKIINYHFADLQTAVSGTYFFFISHTTEAAMSFTANMISGLTDYVELGKETNKQ